MKYCQPLLLISAVIFLTACGAEVETNTQTSALTNTIPSSSKPETQPLDKKVIAEPEKSITSAMNVISTPLTTISASESIPTRPQGRLVGVVVAGEYKQAIINNADQVIRLQEGDDWSGWKVTAIHHQGITITSDEVEQTLALHADFYAPALSVSGAMRHQHLADELAQARLTPSIPAVQSTIPPLVMTTEQLAKVRTHLVAD